MQGTITPQDIFKIVPPADQPLKAALVRSISPLIERVLHFPRLNDIYHRACRDTRDADFTDKALAAVGVDYHVSDEQLARIPREGPLVVVANHPFGGIEGLVLASLLRRVRPDTKLMANYLLGMIPDLRDTFFLVDPFERPDTAKRNLASLRQCMRWLHDGHVLGIFPSGTVSHLNVSARAVVDPAWQQSIGRLLQKTRVPVLPVFFEGRNSNLFQIAGLIHPLLRTMMLPREACRRNGRVSFRIGTTIPPQRYEPFREPADLMNYLRMRTYVLRPEAPKSERQRARSVAALRHMPEVIEPIAPHMLLEDVASLPREAMLVESNGLQVYFATAKQIPNVLREIGRLREISFRLVDEGTGKTCDLDRFDDYYLHLFIWHPQSATIVGGYRMGPSDVIVQQFGKQGLYTSTLFHFKSALLKQISPALELGRSFVHPQWQRSYTPLLMLWRGIGTYCVRNPQYSKLFGPVSISASYTSISKQLLMSFLRHHRFLPDLARLLRPKNPPKYGPPRDFDSHAFSETFTSPDQVNELITQLEQDGKPMPVLLRQYLKLNGALLGFNVDPEFGDVLDGLILIDIPRIDRRLLVKYMGPEGMAQFLQHHGHQA